MLRRCQEADREELNYWIRRYSDAEELKKGASSGQSRQQSPAAQENATSGKKIYHRFQSFYQTEPLKDLILWALNSKHVFVALMFLDSTVEYA